jgi:hypothetical protein
MYTNVDFETFIKSVSAMTGFTGDQIKTLLAYRDVKSLNETTATDLTAELNKLRDEMIKANPTGFGIKGPQTPLFPLEHISKVAGSFTLEELLLMVFIDCPNIKIGGYSKIRPAVMGHRMQLAASLYERGLVSYSRAFQLSGFMSSPDFYVFLNGRKSERARQALGHPSETVTGPERVRIFHKGPISDYTVEYPNLKAGELFPTVSDIKVSGELTEAVKRLSKTIGPLVTAAMSPMYLERSQELIEQEANICAFTKLFYGETEAAKLSKFLILALSEPYFDPILGQKVCSGHRGLTLREMQFTIFLYFNYRELAQEAFEPGEYRAHSRLLNMIIAHAYECNILKVDQVEKVHTRTAEGERLYSMLQAEEIPLKGKYKDLIDWNALSDFLNLARNLTGEEQALFMAVKFPAFIRDPLHVINGDFKNEINSFVSRRILACSMYDKRAVSMETAAKLAGVNLEDFRFMQGMIRAGKVSRKSGQGGN